MTNQEWNDLLFKTNSIENYSVFFNNEKIIKRIEALSKRTIENGCVKAEELEASKKIKQILIKYNLILIDTNIYKELLNSLVLITKL